MSINRREALRRISFMVGGAVIGCQLFLEGCTRTATPEVAALFDEKYIDFLGDVADTILPPTDSPGAKEAGVGSFIPVMIRDCYTKEDQDIFLNGLSEIEKRADKEFGRRFSELSPEDRTKLLTDIDKERQAYEKQKKGDDPTHYFSMLRQLSLLGFFSSELGATKALRYVAVPGRYDGDLPYKKGDRLWAT